MDSQYKLLSELLSDQAAFITSPKTSLANYWGGGHCPPVSTGLPRNRLRGAVHLDRCYFFSRGLLLSNFVASETSLLKYQSWPKRVPSGNLNRPWLVLRL